jgi:hypothetical protein
VRLIENAAQGSGRTSPTKPARSNRPFDFAEGLRLEPPNVDLDCSYG